MVRFDRCIRCVYALLYSPVLQYKTGLPILFYYLSRHFVCTTLSQDGLLADLILVLCATMHSFTSWTTVQDDFFSILFLLLKSIVRVYNFVQKNGLLSESILVLCATMHSVTSWTTVQYEFSILFLLLNREFAYTISCKNGLLPDSIRVLCATMHSFTSWTTVQDEFFDSLSNP